MRGVDVQRILPRAQWLRAQRRKVPKALIWGWPTPISMTARTELPPLPRKPVYGPAAKEECRRLLREAKREKVNFGWRTKISLLKVIRGEKPLGVSVWTRAYDQIWRTRREREAAIALRRPRFQVQIGPGGLRLTRAGTTSGNWPTLPS
jgi:hypothetical protein